MNSEKLIKSIKVNLDAAKKAVNMALQDIDLYKAGSIVAIEDLTAGFESLGKAKTAAYVLKNEYGISDYIESCRIAGVYLNNALELILKRVKVD